MLTCKQITELATDYAEGCLGAADRSLFEAHVGGCPACRAWVRQLAATREALGSLPEPELPVELRAALLRRFDERQAAAGVAARTAAGAVPRWRAVAGGVAVAAAFALLVAFARSPSRAGGDWAVALALVLLAVAFAAVVRRLTPGLVAGGAAAAVLAAVVRGGSGPLAVASGLDCLGTEVAVAVGLAVVAWVAVRRGAGSFLASGLATWAVAGALAGDAALQLTCHASSALAHVLVFHVGGVLVVAAAALLALRLRPQPA